MKKPKKKIYKITRKITEVHEQIATSKEEALEKLNGLGSHGFLSTITSEKIIFIGYVN